MKTHRVRVGATAIAVAALTSIAAAGGAGATAEQAAADKTIVQTAEEAGAFTTLVSLAKRAGLAETLSGPGPFTVFAPTDSAFKKVPKATLRSLQRDRAALRQVLLYHVVGGNVKAAQVVKLRSAKTVNGASVRIGVKGSRVYLNRKARVTKADIAASNGTIHVINRVLIPPTDKNIVQTAASAGQFKTLIRLAKRAGLAGALTKPGKLTVFAPTDQAFARVPRTTLRALERNPRELRRVLLYHVVDGYVGSGRVSKVSRVNTVNGAPVWVGVRGKRVYLNRQSRIAKADVAASNGTIHVIDNVLIPPAH